MNSKNSVRASVSFDMLDGIIQYYSTLIASTPNRLPSQYSRSSGLTSLQNLPREAMPGLMQRGSARFASITGRSAHSIITDEYGIDPLQELNEMCEQCNNKVVVADESKPNKLVADDLFINTNGLSMSYTEFTYSEGDVFFTPVPLHEPREWLTAHLRQTKCLLLSKEEQEHFDFQVLRGIHYSYHNAAELNLMTLHGVVSGRTINNGCLSDWRAALEVAFDSVYKPGRLSYYQRREQKLSVQEAVAEAEAIFAVKVHPKAAAMLDKIILLKYQGQDVTRGDLSLQGRDCMLATLMQLHSYYVNRGAIWVGAGFKDGNPMAVLAKSVFKDGQFQGWILQEQRFGKFIQSVAGPKADARKEIDDLKVLNKAPVMHLCYTEQEWHDAYQAGPSSCMTGFAFDRSPVRVYATGAHGLQDNNLRLCINYTGELFGDNFEVVNRAIVNIKTMHYVRAYGENGEAVMRSLGYEQDTDATNGCILRKIPHPVYEGVYLMPYLDGSQDEIDDLGDYWVIVGNGEYEATDADGYIKTNRCRCSGCEGSYDRDDMQEVASGAMVCDCCIDEAYCTPYNHDDLYRQSECTWSEHMQDFVHDQDLVECAVVGYVHDSYTLYYTVQGYEVIEDYVERRNGAFYLTEEACAILLEDYIPESDDEQEEAA